MNSSVYSQTRAFIFISLHCQLHYYYSLSKFNISWNITWAFSEMLTHVHTFTHVLLHRDLLVSREGKVVRVRNHVEVNTYFFLSLSFLSVAELPACWVWACSSSAAVFFCLKPFSSSSRDFFLSSSFFFSSWWSFLRRSNFSWSCDVNTTESVYVTEQTKLQ